MGKEGKEEGEIIVVIIIIILIETPQEQVLWLSSTVTYITLANNVYPVSVWGTER